MQAIRIVEAGQLKKDRAGVAPGDTVRVSVKVVEGEKERIQVFEGVVIRKRGDGVSASFTVRRISYGVGVERTFPLHSPRIDKIQVMKRATVRRCLRLYFFLSASVSTTWSTLSGCRPASMSARIGRHSCVFSNRDVDRRLLLGTSLVVSFLGSERESG